MDTDGQLRVFVLKSLRHEQLDTGGAGRHTEEDIGRRGRRRLRLDFPRPAWLPPCRYDGESLGNLPDLVLVKGPGIEEFGIGLLAQMLRLLGRGFSRHGPGLSRNTGQQTHERDDAGTAHPPRTMHQSRPMSTNEYLYLPDGLIDR